MPESHSTSPFRNAPREVNRGAIESLKSRDMEANLAPGPGSTCQRSNASCTLCSRILSPRNHLCGRCIGTSGACTLVAMMTWCVALNAKTSQSANRCDDRDGCSLLEQVPIMWRNACVMSCHACAMLEHKLTRLVYVSIIVD